MSDDAFLKQFDESLLADKSDVAAIVIREKLRPVQGPRGVFFPPTFAGIGQGRKSTYHWDEFGPRAGDPEGATRDGLIVNRFTIDSVPSQANRLETRLLRYSGTCIPKVTISGSRVGKPPLDLLEIGHRIGDAVLRYTAENGFQAFDDALRAFTLGDAGPMAMIAPTSLVFGHWDSRGETKSKARRLVRSEIVAYNVAPITKRSQYWSSIDPEVNEELGAILKEAKEAAKENPEAKNTASQLGMTDIPAPQSPGGVIAFGAIERTAIIALSGLRALSAAAKPAAESAKSADTNNGAESGNAVPVEIPAEPGQTVSTTETEVAATGAETSCEAEVPMIPDSDRTLALRRYLFALALASVADTGVWDLREGCILVRNSEPPFGSLAQGESPLTSMRVSYTGEETPFALPSDVAKYLNAASNAFFNGQFPNPRSVTFAPTAAKSAIEGKQQTSEQKTVPKQPTKPDLVNDLMTFPENKGKKTKLNKLKVGEIESEWRTTIVKSLTTKPNYAAKEQELVAMNTSELRDLWLGLQPGAVEASSASTEPTSESEGGEM